MGTFLTIVIAVAVLGYAVYLAVRMFRKPEACCGGCSGCPMSGKCHNQPKD